MFRRKSRPQARANRYLKRASKMRGRPGTQLLGTLAPYQRSYHGNVRSVVTVKSVIEPYVTGGLQRNFTDWVIFPTLTSGYTLFPPEAGISSGVMRDITSLSAQKYWRIKGVKCWLRNVQLNCGLSTTTDATHTTDADWIKPNCDIFARAICHTQSGTSYFRPGEFDTAKRYKVVNGRVYGAIPICFRKIRGATLCQAANAPLYNSLQDSALTWSSAWNVIDATEQGTPWGTTVDRALPGTSCVLGKSGVIRFIPQLYFALNGLPNVGDLVNAANITNVYLKTVFTAEFVTEVIIDAWGDFGEANPGHSTHLLRTVRDLDGNILGEPLLKNLGSSAPSIVLPGSTSDPDPSTSSTAKKGNHATTDSQDFSLYFDSNTSSEAESEPDGRWDSQPGSEEEDHWWSDALTEVDGPPLPALDLSTGETLNPDAALEGRDADVTSLGRCADTVSCEASDDNAIDSQMFSQSTCKGEKGRLPGKLYKPKWRFE